MSHTRQYMDEASQIADQLAEHHHEEIERMAQELKELRERDGRLWIIGLGGSAANASHAAADFQRLCRIRAFCLTDSAAHATAIANDDGWDMLFDMDWHDGDALFVLSVGGGTKEVSKPIMVAVGRVSSIGGKIFGIVGRDGGYTAMNSDSCLVIPTVNEKHVTPHTEAFQMVVLHCLVSHPLLQKRPTRW